MMDLILPSLEPVPPFWLNSGGPRSRSRTERIRSTLLGRNRGAIRCPRRFKLALDFGDDDPWECVMTMLAAHGFGNAEDLRGVFELPGPMVCRSSPEVEPRVVRCSDPMTVLNDALLLGLSTVCMYDPSRPVLWTRSSLTRRLVLFDTREFYA